MPLFVDDKRISIQEVIKLLTHKEVEPGKDGTLNPFKVKNEIIGKFGDPKAIFRFTVLPSDVRPDVDNPRKVWQLPNSKSVEAFYNFTDYAGETHTLRYALSNPRKKKLGTGEYTEYSPEFIDIDQTGTLEVRGNAELAVFMHYHTANLESGNNVPGGVKMFQTFIGQKRSARNVDRSKIKYRAEQLFLDYEKKLSFEDMKTLANTIVSKKLPNNFYNLDEMSEAEIIDEFTRLCSVDPERIWSLYLGIDNTYRKEIKKFKEAKVLIFQPYDLTWRMPLDNGGDEVLTTVPLKHDANEWIINFLIDDNKGFRKKLENSLEKAKAKTPEPEKTPAPEKTKVPV